MKDDVRRFFNRVNSADGLRAKVGIQTGDGSKDRGGITMAGLALVHEFGSETAGVPQRSFLRSTVDENERKYVRIMKARLVEITKQRITAKAALTEIGERVRSDVLDKIRGGIPPPNAPSTVARKGSSTPLVDTGQLLQAITSKVEG